MILIGIPYHQNKRYAMNHILDWLEKQDYPYVEPILRVHNGAYGEPNAVKDQFEFFRLLALERHDDLFIMEADTIPPLDGLACLVADDRDVVGGLYRYRSPDKPIVAWPKDNIQENSGLVTVDGMGTGCVLLRHSLLDTFSFHDWPQPDADYPLYDTLRRHGHDIWLDTDVICRHYADNETWY